MSDLGIALEVPRHRSRQHFIMHGVPWSVYDSIGEIYRNRSSFRLTYDRGVLEIMSLSFNHEKIKYFVGCLIDVMTEVLDMKVIGGGSTTFRRKDLERALEPDRCYYSRHFDDVAGKDEIDLSVDPPPDLCVEIDVTNLSLNRMGIYAKLKVPEIWRWEDGSFTVHTLRAGRYVAGSQSKLFVSGFVPADFVPYFEIGIESGKNAMVKAFRKHLKKWLAERN